MTGVDDRDVGAGFGEVAKLDDDAEIGIKKTTAYLTSASVLVARRTASKHGLDVGLPTTRTETTWTFPITVKGFVPSNLGGQNVFLPIEYGLQLVGIEFFEVHGDTPYEYTT